MCKVNILIYCIHSVSKFINFMGPFYFWQCLLHQMLLSWYLRVTSIKLTKHQSWSEPIDRTPGLPGSDKNCPISGIFLDLIVTLPKRRVAQIHSSIIFILITGCLDDKVSSQRQESDGTAITNDIFPPEASIPCPVLLSLAFFLFLFLSLSLFTFSYFHFSPEK